MVRHASWLPAVRAGEWTDAQTGVHSNLRGREGVKVVSPITHEFHTHDFQNVYVTDSLTVRLPETDIFDIYMIHVI